MYSKITIVIDEVEFNDFDMMALGDWIEDRFDTDEYCITSSFREEEE